MTKASRGDSRSGGAVHGGNKTGSSSTPGLRDALAVVTQLGKEMSQERTADYKVALSASKAGQAGLRAQFSKIEAVAAKSTKKQARAVGNLTRAARANQRNVRDQLNATVDRYGSALGGSVTQAYAGATTAAAGTTRNLEAAGKTTRRGVNTQNVLETLGRQGVAAQSQSAKYALAQALQQRTIVDNQTLAGLTEDLYSKAIDYNQQWTLWKKQQDYATKQAKKTAREEERKAYPGIQRVIDSSWDDAHGLMQTWQAMGETATAGSVAQKYIQDQGITDPNEAALVIALARKFDSTVQDPSTMYNADSGTYNYAGTQLEADIKGAVNSTILSLYPHYTPAYDVLDAAAGSATAGKAVAAASSGLSATLAEEGQDFAAGLDVIGGFVGDVFSFDNIFTPGG